MKIGRKTFIVSVLLVCCAFAAANAASGTKKSGDAETLYKELELFSDALSIVQADYVEEPEAKDLIYGALKGMLATLDPYSQFLDPDSYNELKIDTEGQFGGLGIEITIKDDLLTIITPLDDSPAFNAGLKSGDRIVKIDGKITRDINLLEAVKQLRGKPGTQVNITVLREGENELKEFTLTRDIIKIQSIKEAKIIEDNIGYVRMTDFREGTPQDLENALKDLNSKGMDSLILDLRNNPGGLLDVAVSSAELFLQKKQMIVTTKGRLKNQNMEFRSRKDGLISDIPIVVLVNEGSASASEILAGALQDDHRGIVLGAKTHGKASVQTIFPLKDGSALRLTTSKYFTPSGKLIHGEGIHPDVVVEYVAPPVAKDKDPDSKPEKTAEDIFDDIDDAQAKEKKEKPMDNQLSRAVDLLKGLKIYQSSIMPNQKNTKLFAESSPESKAQ